MTKIKRLALSAIDYADLLLAAGLAVTFAVLGALGVVDGDVLVQANLALLGVLSFGLFRERWMRMTATEKADRSLAARENDRPWQVLEEELEWDLSDRLLATATATREIRFTQAESVSVYEFQSTPPGGKLLLHTCQGRRRRTDTPRSLPIMKEIVGPFGRSYTLISLERIYVRGEHLHWVSTRKLQGYFPGKTENVSKAIQMPTDHLTMRVMWPPDCRPHEVRLERSDTPARILETKVRGGRTHVTAIIEDARLGEVISVAWDWAPDSPPGAA
jgi:hypothetical protein